MKKKNTVKKIAVSALCLAFAFSCASCDLISTNSEKDMKQVIGNVTLADHADLKAGGDYAEYAEVIGKVNGKILKRDLVAYFLSVGSNYIQNGYTYERTFNMLMDNLVSRKIMVQYSMVYYFDSDESEVGYNYTVADYNSYIEKETQKLDDSVKVHYDAHPELLTLQYFLTDGGSDFTEYNQALYSLKRSINNTLDSAEAEYIKADDDSSSGTASRTTPTGVGTEKEDYYPADENGNLDYDVYTGRNTLDSCGTYEKIDGSTQTYRTKAYNSLLANLSANGLIGKKENTSKLENTDYYYVELASQLEQALITKYSDDLLDASNEELVKEYIEGKYADIVSSQKSAYDLDHSAFETAIGNASDSSFVLYSPKKGFGFVYNILLPFSSTQAQILSTYTNDAGLTKSEFYRNRAELLENVQGKDLRSAWFSSNEDNNYAYEAEKGTYYSEGNRSNYLFFKDNLTDNERYEGLGQYYGKYPYNGTVTKDENAEYVCTPNKLDIDEFMAEMESYLGYAGLTASGAKCGGYVSDGKYTLTDGEFDYSEFMYYEGRVALTQTEHKDYFVEDTDAYKAVSVINELMFAYSTDTGCLNKYMGYTVSPYKTNYVAEFEYAAQYAINQGVGSYVVCPSDYGWHVIYVSFAYDQGEVYGGFNWEEREEEGTFSYLFYESLKSGSSSSTSYASMVQNRILTKYNDESCVKKYTDRYKDLLSLS